MRSGEIFKARCFWNCVSHASQASLKHIYFNFVFFLALFFFFTTWILWVKFVATVEIIFLNKILNYPVFLLYGKQCIFNLWSLFYFQVCVVREDTRQDMQHMPKRYVEISKLIFIINSLHCASFSTYIRQDMHYIEISMWCFHCMPFVIIQADNCEGYYVKGSVSTP